MSLAAIIVAGAVVVHGLMPRYEFSIVGADGGAVVIFDRWTGQFQRANYDSQGVPTLTPIVKPF